MPRRTLAACLSSVADATMHEYGPLQARLFELGIKIEAYNSTPARDISKEVLTSRRPMEHTRAIAVSPAEHLAVANPEPPVNRDAMDALIELVLKRVSTKIEKQKEP